MPVYNGWNVVFVPAFPPAPAVIEFSQNDAVAMNISPFSFQQQVQNWGATQMEAKVSMPPMKQSDGENWVAFLRSLQGMANVFQFGSAFVAKYPEIGTRYWRLKGNLRSWTVTKDRVYLISFDVIEAI